MHPFEPLFRSAHAQTLAGHFWKRDGLESRFPIERRLFRTEPDVEVLVQSQRPAGEPAGQIVMIHGLEGSGASGYLVSLSAAALRAGFTAHRFHMRTCGGTEQLCRTLYHAGLTSDLAAVLRQLRAESDRPLFVVGFSLGGNVALKLAGESGDSARQWIRGVCAVSTPLDLDLSTRRLARLDNRVYEFRFLRRMRARLCATGRYRRQDFAGMRTIRDIDDRITAPSFGFVGAAHYYRTQSSFRYLDGIRVPVFLVQARDDHFVPFEIFESETVRANPWIELLATSHGGHMGFIGRQPHRFWLDEAIMEWTTRQAAKDWPVESSGY